MSVLPNVSREMNTINPTQIKESKALFKKKRIKRIGLTNVADREIAAGVKTTSVEELLKGRIQYSKEVLEYDTIVSKMIAEKVRSLNTKVKDKNLKISMIVAKLAKSKMQQKEEKLSLN